MNEPADNENLSQQSLADGSVTLDLDRQRRCGYPEAIYGQGKTVPMMAEIMAAQIERGQTALATRIDPDAAQQLLRQFPKAHWNQIARTIRTENPSDNATRGTVAVIAAGSTDLPVAEEAKETLSWMGVKVTQINDVGVAGPHRLPARLSEFEAVDAIVVVAGMEGALPSVVAGYVACPVIAVPTSVGYGANLSGMAALLSMINSCAANVAVVNIDAGFKGGYLAGMIAQRCYPANESGDE